MLARATVGCVDSATDILGDKWTPKLLRFFMNEETVHFCELQDMVGGINPRTLSDRLIKLEQSGVIIKDGTDYSLTAKGTELLPILRSMEAWSERYAQTE